MDSGKTPAMPRITRGGAPPVDNSYQAIGKRLRQLRLAFGKTQEELAAIIGVSPGMISKCEKGESRLSADHMLKLLVAYDVPLEWLYLGWGRHLSRELRDKLDKISLERQSPPSSSSS